LEEENIILNARISQFQVQGFYIREKKSKR